MWLLAGFAVGALGVFCTANLPLTTNRESRTTNCESRFGDWLAAQHAVFADDFEAAMDFLEGLSGDKNESVSAMRAMVLFLDTADIKDVQSLKKINIFAFRLINSAVMARDGKWAAVRGIFKNERSQMFSPFRIWSAVGDGKFKDALAFIDKNPRAAPAWRDFSRGAVYAATKNPKTARKYFARVPVSFMNLGDYHLAMSFYKQHGFEKDAAALRKKWTDGPGGMFMANLDLKENWGAYDSFQKMLSAGLVQNVSHGGEQGFTDSGLLMLRIAAMIGGGSDALDYYTGGYFYSVGSGNYRKYWDKLKANPVYAPFVEMKEAEKNGSARKSERMMNKILRKHPLFVPVIQKLWRKNMQNGRENDNLRILDRALAGGAPDAGRAYLMKMRAQTLYVSGDYAGAEADLIAAAKLAPMDAGVMGLSARVWAAEKKNLDEAYRYAISLVKAFPGNVENWDILAMVVLAKEGSGPAREILERVGRVAEECSELFLHLGDLRAKDGENLGAARAYEKAIALSDDGLVIKGDVERKLKRLR
jgi:tetratricopeptide (TPR) repeat protein